MKVLLISNMGPHKRNPSLGRFVINQYEELRKGSYQIEMFLMPKIAYSFKSSIIRYFSFVLFFLLFLCKNFLKKRFDIIHIHFFYPTVYLAIFYKLFINRRVKIITTFHGNDVYSYNPNNFLYRKAMSYIDHAIYVSERLMLRHDSFNISKTVLPAGIKNDFKVMKNVEKKYDFIFVGNLELVKGADRLLSIVKNFPEYRFAIVGSGSFENELKAINSDNFDYFPSLKPNALSLLMNESKCLLNLSRNESFGLVITEALSCGIFVIATKTDGSLEQLESINNGWFLEQEYTFSDVANLYENQIANSLIEGGSIVNSHHYRIESVCEKITELYYSTLKS